MASARESEILDVTPSRSKPDRGILRMAYQTLNQRGEMVMSVTCLHLLARRPGVRVEEETGFLHYTAPMITTVAPFAKV